MKKAVYFTAGVVAGVYADQSYKIPSIKSAVEKLIRIMKYYEK